MLSRSLFLPTINRYYLLLDYCRLRQETEKTLWIVWIYKQWRLYAQSISFWGDWTYSLLHGITNKKYSHHTAPTNCPLRIGQLLPPSHIWHKQLILPGFNILEQERSLNNEFTLFLQFFTNSTLVRSNYLKKEIPYRDYKSVSAAGVWCSTAS